MAAKNPEKGLVKQGPTRFEVADQVAVTADGVKIATLAQMKVWAEEVAKSGMAPKGLDTEAKVMLAAQTGMELGFSLMRSLQAVVIVNGRATLMGEAAIALIRASGLLEAGTDIEVGCRRATKEEVDGKEGPLVGYCRSTRRGQSENETLFTVADAMTAGLWKGKGPWSTYPKRMLMYRAVGFHMRDYWSDLGNGLMLDVEARDIPRSASPVRDVTPKSNAVTGRRDPLVRELRGDPTEPVAPEESEELEALEALDVEWEPAGEDELELEEDVNFELEDESFDRDEDDEGPDDPGAEFFDENGNEIDPETGEVIPDHVGRE